MTETTTAPLDAEVLRKALRTTFESGRTRPLEWRKAQLAGLRRMMDECRRRAVEALVADLGRSRMEAYAADIGHTKSSCATSTGTWPPGCARRRSVGARSPWPPPRRWVQTEPLGVALVIAPWNYPIQLLLEPMAAALAAGNCVVAKPSELSPACSATILASCCPATSTRTPSSWSRAA